MNMHSLKTFVMLCLIAASAATFFLSSSPPPAFASALSMHVTQHRDSHVSIVDDIKKMIVDKIVAFEKEV